MRFHIPILLSLALTLPLFAKEPGPRSLGGGMSYDDLMDGQPKLLRLSANVDGSGRIIFTRQSARYEHKQWTPPTKVIVSGEPWTDLSRTPPSWQEIAGNLDLTKAWVVNRKGRDVIALEHTPDGFDIYLCDSPNGSADYEVTIAIPRRTSGN